MSQSINGLRRSPGERGRASRGMPAGPQSGSRQQNESERDGGEGEGQTRSDGRPDVDDRKLTAFLAGKQFGLGHGMGQGVGRSVERELIAQPPSKDAETQDHKDKREAVQAFAPTEDRAHRRFR